MSKDIFQELKETLNRIPHPPRIREVILKNTNQTVFLGETDFGKHF